MTVYGHDRGSAVVVVGDVPLLGNWVGTHFKNTNSSCDSAVKDKNTHLGGRCVALSCRLMDGKGVIITAMVLTSWKGSVGKQSSKPKTGK